MLVPETGGVADVRSREANQHNVANSYAAQPHQRALYALPFNVFARR